ncbi:MAG: hypothetical protein ACK5O3_07225 [Burkholderiales bacterium]
MTSLLLIGAFVFFAFMAPPKTTAMFVGIALLVSLVVKVSAQAIGNVSVTLLQTIRAVAFSLLLVTLAMFTLWSFSLGTGVTEFTGMAAIAVLGGLFLAYALGFAVGLGTTLGASCGIAVVSTIVSGLLFGLGSRLA